jgi:hypothetical protein
VLIEECLFGILKEVSAHMRLRATQEWSHASNSILTSIAFW